MKTNFETGATTHALNDLILFAENTREWAERRDKQFESIRKNLNTELDAFRYLFNIATGMYCKQFPDSCQHILDITPAEFSEWCNLMKQDFNA